MTIFQACVRYIKGINIKIIVMSYSAFLHWIKNPYDHYVSMIYMEIKHKIQSYCVDNILWAMVLHQSVQYKVK